MRRAERIVGADGPVLNGGVTQFNYTDNKSSDIH